MTLMNNTLAIAQLAKRNGLPPEAAFLTRAQPMNRYQRRQKAHADRQSSAHKVKP